MIAERQIAKLEHEIATAETLTREDLNIGSEQAEELEEYRANFLRFARFDLENLRGVYERAREATDNYKAAFRFEETSELVKFYGSIFKEKPKPKKRVTATRSRKTSRRQTTAPKR